MLHQLLFIDNEIDTPIVPQIVPFRWIEDAFEPARSIQDLR